MSKGVFTLYFFDSLARWQHVPSWVAVLETLGVVFALASTGAGITFYRLVRKRDRARRFMRFIEGVRLFLKGRSLTVVGCDDREDDQVFRLFLRASAKAEALSEEDIRAIETLYTDAVGDNIRLALVVIDGSDRVLQEVPRHGTLPPYT